jgi:hypothetical protein
VLEFQKALNTKDELIKNQQLQLNEKDLIIKDQQTKLNPRNLSNTRFLFLEIGKALIAGIIGYALGKF